MWDLSLLSARQKYPHFQTYLYVSFNRVLKWPLPPPPIPHPRPIRCPALPIANAMPRSTSGGEKRNGLIVQGDLTQADGHAERKAALDIVHRHSPGSTR
jgi:hypothetical protein